MSKLFNFILFLSFQVIIKSDNVDENKYSFQLYPSWEQDMPYYFYAQANNELITINSTDGENCNIIGRKENEEYSYKDLSSTNIIDDTYLVKTCFGPNKLVEILSINKETFIYNNNNFNNIKFCYSTKVYNPLNNNEHQDKYVIITYWTEIKSITDRERYTHKCILFYPESKTFSQEFTLKSGSQFVINIYYPEKCVTFRDTDIFCVIHYIPAENDDVHVLGNNYVIETKNIILDAIYNQIESVNLVISNSQISSKVYQRPIALKKASNSRYGFIDVYMTEYHNSEGEGKGKVSLMYSYYKKYIHRSYIPFTTNVFIGINIEDNYVHQDLFNYLVPNEDELIIIYISQEDKMSLILNRFNASDSSSKQLNKGFKNYAYNSYIRTDICDKPKYLQSIYINSFISYDDKDKNIINSNPDINYYKYQKDIGVLISCDNDQNGIEYESKRIKLPQCLNTLDELNGNDKHILKFGEDENEIIFDIYNDPNLASLRNTSIIFYKPEIFSIYVDTSIKIEGLPDFTNIVYNATINRITHIKFTKTKYYNLLKRSKTFTLPYRLKKNVTTNGISSNIISDICNIAASPGEECPVDNCFSCQDSTHCSICYTSIKGMTLDEETSSETYSKCICDEKKNFKKIPVIIENNEICVCKDNYAYYKDMSYCMSKDSIHTGPFYKNGTDELTGIDIYDDCYQTCQKCSNFSNSADAQYCTECKNGYKLQGINCIPESIYYIEPTTPIYHQKNCSEERKVWFELGRFKFYYLKIDKCVFIFYEDQLFFYSNKSKCQRIGKIYSYNYISKCISNSNGITNDSEYIEFLNKYPQYNEEDDKISIFKRVQDGDKNILFHLESLKANTKNDTISHLYFGDNAKYDLIAFKADIKRQDTISTQVEYQFYKSNDEFIYERVSKSDLGRYKISKDNKGRRLDGNDISDGIFLELPVDWKEGQLEKIKELDSKGINAFDSKSEFYLDVCYKYTTPDKKDIYLQDRKEKYFPDEKFCETQCEFQKKINLETGNVLCKCPIKEDTSKFNSISFKEIEKGEEFNKKFINPHYKVIGCPNVSENLGKNFGFYWTFIFLVFFLCLCGKRIYDLYLNNDEVKCNLKEFEGVIFPKIKEKEEEDKKDESMSEEERNIPFKNEEDKNLKPSDEDEVNNDNKDDNKDDNQKEKKSNSSSIKLDDIKNKGIRTLSQFDSSQSENHSLDLNKSKKSETLTLQENQKDGQSPKEGEDNSKEKDKNDNETNDNNENNGNKENNKNNENEENKENNALTFNNDNISQSQNESENNNDKDKENISQNLNINDEMEKEKEKETKNELIDESKDEKNNSQNLIGNSDISIEVQNDENDKKEDNDEKKEHKTEKLKESIQKSKLKSTLNPRCINMFNSIKTQNTIYEGNENDANKNKEDEEKNNLDKLLSSYANRNVIDSDEYDRDDNSIIKNDQIKPKESNLPNINELIQNTTHSAIMDKSIINKEDNNSKKKEEKDISIIEKVKDDNNEDNEDNLDCINIGDDLISEKNNNGDLISSQSQDNESNHSVMVNQMVPPCEIKKKKKKVKKVANPPSKTKNDISKDNNDDDIISEMNAKVANENKNKNNPIESDRISLNKENSENNDRYKNIDKNNEFESYRISIKDGRRVDNKENKNEKKFSSDNSYLLDRKSYDYLIENIKNENLGDNRSFMEMLLSVIKSNSTLMYILLFKIDDIKIKVSILILSINLYIFVTASLQYNMTMLLLYNNFWFGGLLLYALISCLVSFPIIICKKYLSVYGLFYEMFSLHIEYAYKEKVKRDLKHSICNSKDSIKLTESIIQEKKASEIGNKISKYVQNVLIQTIIYTAVGFVFLLINAIFIISFCGIYPNSVISLFLNTFMSILMSCVFIIIFRSIGVTLRYFGLKQQNKLMYNISRFFNILNLTWDDFMKIIFSKKEKKQEKKQEKEPEKEPENKKNLKDKPDDELV